jgi:hypothetical protein
MSRVVADTKLSTGLSTVLQSITPGTELSFRDFQGVTYYGTAVSNDENTLVIHPAGMKQSDTPREIHITPTTERFQWVTPNTIQTPNVGTQIESLWVWG